MKKKLNMLIMSNGGKPELFEYSSEYIKEFLDENFIDEVLYIPYAQFDYDKNFKKVSNYWNKFTDVKLVSILDFDGFEKDVIEKAKCFLVWGGNTFKLLNELYKKDLVDILKRRVERGICYMGVSAGSNIVCPTIQTSNDMALFHPKSYDSLNLVPFNLNVHYFEAGEDFIGETKDDRIGRFHLIENRHVLGLCERCLLKIKGDNMRVFGKSFCKVFYKNGEVEYFKNDEDVSKFL